MVLLAVAGGLLASVGLFCAAAYFLLLSGPQQTPGTTSAQQRVKGTKEEGGAAVETTAWINQVVIQWLCAMVFTGGSGDCTIVSDRLCYLAGKALGSRPSGSSSDSSSPATMLSLQQRALSAQSSGGGGGGGHSPHRTRASPFKATDTSSNVALPVARGSRPHPRLKTLRLSAGPDGIVRTPVIGSITSEQFEATISSSSSTTTTGSRSAGTVTPPASTPKNLPAGSALATPPPSKGTSSQSPGPSPQRMPTSLGSPGGEVPVPAEKTMEVPAWRFRVPLSFDDFRFLATLDCDVPLLMGLSSYGIAADLATLRTDIELKGLRIDAVMLIEVYGSDSMLISFEVEPKWEASVSTKFGSKMQSINGGSKVEEIIKLAVGRFCRQLVYPHGLKGEFRLKTGEAMKWSKV